MAKKDDSGQGVSERCFDASREETTENVVRKSGTVRCMCRRCGERPCMPGRCKRNHNHVCSKCFRQRPAFQRYLKSETRKAAHKRQGKSPAGKARHARYERTEKKRVVAHRYLAKPTVKEHRRWGQIHRRTGNRLAEMSL